VFGDRVVFLEKRLSAEQQVGFLIDFVIERNVALSPEHLGSVSSKRRTVLERVGVTLEPVAA
jgi:hypothetical protein